MDTASIVLLHFAALAILVTLAALGSHLVAGKVAASSVPPSVMGPGYNAPPPHIPVS